MKYQYFLPFLALVTSALSVPAAAQGPTSGAGPWTMAPTAPPFCNCYTSTYGLQLPGSGVWAVRNNSQGPPGTFTNTIISSVDNGQTWQMKAYTGRNNTSMAYGVSVRDLFALDGLRAWAVTYAYPSGATEVLQTTTGAADFAAAPTQPTGQVSFLRFFDANTGIAVTRLATGATGWPLQRTTDGGLTWVPVTGLPAFVPGIQPLAVAQLGSNLWVTMEQGKVLHTADAGQTWTVATTAQDFIQLTFRDAQNGLAVGNVNTRPLFRTSDGGTTWTPVTTTGPRRLVALAAVPGSAGTYLSVGQPTSSYLDGDQPGTAISYNDGQTWQDLGGTSWLEAVAADAQGRAWASFYGYGNLAYLAAIPLASRPAQSAQLALYPNPTTGQVTLPAVGKFRQLQAYDAAGRLCLTVPVSQGAATVDLGSLPSGLYMVRLQDNGGSSVQQRLVVTR